MMRVSKGKLSFSRSCSMPCLCFHVVFPSLFVLFSVCLLVLLPFVLPHQGGIGQPYGGFVEPLRSKVLKGAKVYEARPGAAIPPVDFERLKAELKEKFPQEKIRDVDVMSAALYPQVFNEYMEFKQKYGPVHLLPTPNYFVPTPMGEEVAVTLRPGLLLFLLLLLRSFPLLCFSLLCSFSSFLRLSPLLSFLSFQLAVCCFLSSLSSDFSLQPSFLSSFFLFLLICLLWFS